MKPTIHVIGGGLAGSEAAWQALHNGCKVKLYEMRSLQLTPAHKTPYLAELVCSNSLKSKNPLSAPGLLKHEMRSLDSLILKAADKAEVPAGQALAVDRQILSQHVEESLNQHPDFERIDTIVTEIPSEEELIKSNSYWILATGPLTEHRLAENLAQLCGKESLAFYDAIAPVLCADSLDMNTIFRCDRYGTPGEGDYLNIPLNKEQYEEFIQDVLSAEKMPLHDFESVKYFECCLPIEVMAERGPETLRFGPMKPVGLIDPKTNERPWACIQLRQENQHQTMFSMVGFQSKMKWPEQKRIFQKLPGLENIEFLRYGSVHRNTYVEGPEVLNPDLSLKRNSRVLLAGQITGVEGYTESSAIGLLAGRIAALKANGNNIVVPPSRSMIGALARYITTPHPGHFAPMNANFGLLPPIEKKRGERKADKKIRHAKLSQESFENWMKSDPQTMLG